MFGHIFVNRLKCLVRNRVETFWTFMFPIVLASLFALAFSNLSAGEGLGKIKTAVVDNAAYQSNPAFQSALAAAAGSGDSGHAAWLDILPATPEQAAELLENNQVAGYIVLDEGPRLVVKEYGLEQAIIKEFMDTYVQTSFAISSIAEQNPYTPPTLVSDAAAHSNYLQEVSPTRSKPATYLNYYYALIAMACLFGGFRGLSEVAAVQANISPQGARVSLSPTHKLKIFGYSLCAAATVQLASLFLLIAYLRVVLQIDFGDDLLYVLLACFAGNLTGVSMGAMIGALVKKGEKIKIAVLIATSLLLSFLAGLMAADVRYAVTHAVPVLAYINPANLITDAFYSLYYYDTYTRFFTDIKLLLAFSGAFFLVVYLVLRRQRYASL